VKEESTSTKLALRDVLTVEDLIEELQGMDQKARVIFACDFGDHAHTEQALPVMSVEPIFAGEHALYDTAYSESGVGIREIDDIDELVPSDEAHKHVIAVVLRHTR
jgi:hypothetical protein